MSAGKEKVAMDGSWLDGLKDVPFLIGAAGIRPKLSATRVIESVVIACITAIATFALFVWQALPLIEQRLAQFEVHLERIERVNDEQDRKLYQHEGAIRRTQP
jgi:hypothetical protein